MTDTFCRLSTVAASNRFPISGHVRPAQDISPAFSGADTAWDARLALSRATVVATGGVPRKMVAAVFRGPNESTPLKVEFALPSQKFLTLKTAFKTVGALRPVERRAAPNTGSVVATHASSTAPAVAEV